MEMEPAPRGRRRTRSSDYEAMFLRFPPAVVRQLRELAHDEERSINTVVFRLIRHGLEAEGHTVASTETVDTVYHS